MVQTAFETSKDVDLVLFVIEANSKEIGKGDRLILDKIKEGKKPTILVINKIDLIKKEELLQLIEMYSKEYNFEAVIPISARSGEKTEELLEEIEKFLPVRTKVL